MRGVVLLGDRELEVRQFPDPKPGPGEVVVAIRASGICGSDLHSAYRVPKEQLDPSRPPIGQVFQKAPDVTDYAIAGHEPCGVVVERGPDVSEAQAPIGARVIPYHYRACGRCKHCRVGDWRLCLRGFQSFGFSAHGSHADYMVAVASGLTPLPEELSFEAGAAIACGTGTAYGGLVRLDVSGRDTLAVFGQGPVGLSGTMLGRAMGARVIAIDVAPERLAMAKELGADVVLNPIEVDPIEAVRELTHGEGADAVLEASGNERARLQAVRCARVRGRVCYVGEGGTATFDMTMDIIHKLVTIYGSWTFSVNGQEECTRFVTDRNVPLERLITHRFTLDQADEAFRLFDTGTTGKVVFVAD
jgi:threonine dehydrogenase-like Zn-dependent dehydrogenase